MTLLQMLSTKAQEYRKALNLGRAEEAAPSGMRSCWCQQKPRKKKAAKGLRLSPLAPAVSK